MVKLLVLQQWYGLSDPELERQAVNRIDFQRFLGFPEQPPDYSTVWQFRERLAATRTDSLVWAELQRQLGEKGLRVRKGVAQDASFIEVDPGPSGKPRGDEAATRRSRDGDWAKREKLSVFGYKLHLKTDLDHGLVRAVEATPTSVHDSRVDLSEPDEVVYLTRATSAWSLVAGTRR
jgi:IS5 family transposase